MKNEQRRNPMRIGAYLTMCLITAFALFAGVRAQSLSAAESGIVGTTEDDVITALDQAVACMESTGVSVDSATFDSGRLSIKYFAADPERAQDVKESCFASHFEAAALAYGREHAPTGAELAAFYDNVVDCLRAKGHAVASPAKLDAADIGKDRIDCQFEAEAKLNLDEIQPLS